MFQRIYYVPQQTGTQTDALVAFGFAVLLEQLLTASQGRQSGEGVRLLDAGSHYHIILPEPIQEEWLERTLPLDMVWAIKGKKPFPEDVPALDYQATWDEIRKERALRAAQRAAGGSQGREAVQDLLETAHLQHHRDIVLLIGDYRMQAAGIHNQAILQWTRTLQAGYQAANLHALLHLFASPTSDLREVIETWASTVKLKGIKKMLTSSQMFNPSSGKGHNRTNRQKLLMESVEFFWLLEYLKAVGLFASAAPRSFSTEGIRKTYVLAPLNISLGKHREIFHNLFEPLFYGLGSSPMKADILASLQYSSAYLSYCLQARRRSQDERDLNPKHSIAGFYVTTYTLLSQNSYTMLNLSFLGLPPWLHHIDTLSDVVAVQAVIEEQENLIRPLEEEFQESNNLLRTYRDFLTGQQISAFFEFCAGYGEYVVRTLPSKSRMRQYSVKSLDEIFWRIAMTGEPTLAPTDQENHNENDLTEFSFANGLHPGFHRIAYAIRWSTVIPQRQNAKVKSHERAEKPLYDIRYGLGENLRRKANSAQELLGALTDFSYKYNAETEQVYESTSQARISDPGGYARTHYRQRIQLSDLDDVLALIKIYGPELVCNVLVAYGYGAMGSRDSEEEKANDSEHKFDGQEN